MSKWNYCTWPLENGQDCGKVIPPSEVYCREHEQESRAWDEDARDMNQIAREWKAYRNEGDETPPYAFQAQEARARMQAHPRGYNAPDTLLPLPRQEVLAAVQTVARGQIEGQRVTEYQINEDIGIIEAVFTLENGQKMQMVFRKQ